MTRAIPIVVLLWATGCGPEADPPNPCTRNAIDYGLSTVGRPAVDVLLVVDPNTTPAARGALANELPRLVESLSSGRGSDGTELAPVDALRFGVISTAMGGPGCGDDDGVLLGDTRCEVDRWIDFGRGDDAEAVGSRAGCQVNAVEGGCTFSQPLEAALAALTPSTSGTTFAGGTVGHGDGANLGFLRDGSTLVVVVLSQGDDCSVADPALLDPDTTAYPSPLESRCTSHPEALTPVERFVEGLAWVRPDGRLYVMPIAGVPLDLVPDSTTPLEVPVETALADARLQPGMSCASETLGPSTPPRRLLEATAGIDRGLGVGLLGSTCGTDLSAPIDSLIAAVGGGWFGCLARPFLRETDGRIRCRVTELVDPSSLDSCEELPGRTSAGVDEGTGLLRCVVHQLAIDADDRFRESEAVGWYYDDFSDFVHRYCGERPHRLDWRGTTQTEGSILQASCDPAGFAPPAGVGDACSSGCPTPSETLASFPFGLACDPASETCQPRCTDSWDCGAGWTCFDADGDGVPHCINPTC